MLREPDRIRSAAASESSQRLHAFFPDPMKLKHLQALQAVAESGSIQEASRKLFLTQPAVSRTIRELENELGIPLLVRTARGATLTDHAAQILKRARAIDRELSRIYEDVDAT